MKDKIRFLISLQDCDNGINRIISQKNEGPLSIQQLEDELNANEMKFQEEYHRLESLKIDKRNIEQEIQDLEINIDKSDNKLIHIKSNREYKAVLKEIEEFKKGKFLTEDKVIQIMEAIEDLDKKCLDDKDRQEELKRKFEKDKVEVSKELRDMNRRQEELEKKRNAFCQTIDGELLKRYNFLRDRKGGQAISSVIDGICKTCNMGIPPQTFNELKKGNSLLTCPNCNRIIYWGDDEYFSDLRLNQSMLEQDK